MADNWTERLSEYLDDELTGDERRQIEAHIAACRDCTATLDELRAVIARAPVLPSRPPAADLWPGVEARLDATLRIIRRHLEK